MKYKFSCHICGENWLKTKRELSKEDYINRESKEGRPILACKECNAKIVGFPMN